MIDGSYLHHADENIAHNNNNNNNNNNNRKRIYDAEGSGVKHACLQQPPPVTETLTFALYRGAEMRWFRRGPMIAKGRNGTAVFECAQQDVHQRLLAWHAVKFVFRGRPGSQNERCADTELAVGKLMAERRHPNVSATLFDGEISFTTGRFLILVNDPSPCSLFDLFQYRVSGECRTEYLRSALAAANNQYSPFYMMSQITAGLAHLHRNNVLHNDIKAGNVLVDSAALTLKLCDFGLSRVFDQGSDSVPYKSFDGGPVGSKSPEAVLGCSSIGRASDVYGLGCLMYRLYSMGHAHWMWSASNEEQLAQMIAHYGPISEWNTGAWATGVPASKVAQLNSRFVPTAQAQAAQALRDSCISDPQAQTLFRSMLALDPKARPSCDQLLAAMYISH
jgi:serine/threonine protein kinase